MTNEEEFNSATYIEDQIDSNIDMIRLSAMIGLLLYRIPKDISSLSDHGTTLYMKLSGYIKKHTLICNATYDSLKGILVGFCDDHRKSLYVDYHNRHIYSLFIVLVRYVHTDYGLFIMVDFKDDQISFRRMESGNVMLGFLIKKGHPNEENHQKMIDTEMLYICPHPCLIKLVNFETKHFCDAYRTLTSKGPFSELDNDTIIATTFNIIKETDSAKFSFLRDQVLGLITENALTLQEKIRQIVDIPNLDNKISIITNGSRKKVILSTILPKSFATLPDKPMHDLQVTLFYLAMCTSTSNHGYRIPNPIIRADTNTICSYIAAIETLVNFYYYNTVPAEVEK